MLNRFTGSAERKAGLVAGVPLQRVGEPDEIANAIVFLASDKSSFTTGQRNAVYTKRGTAIAGRTRFARDSLLEGDGFELPVPRRKSRGFPQHSGGIGGALKRYHLMVQPFFFCASNHSEPGWGTV